MDSPPSEVDRQLDSKERDLGLDMPITRRDFLNSALLASGAVLLNTRAPLGQQTPGPTGAAWEAPTCCGSRPAVSRSRTRSSTGIRTGWPRRAKGSEPWSSC